jgi:hypothetical protein
MKTMKKIVALVMAMAMVVGSNMTVFAAGWQQNATGWWWQNDDGSWPANSWQWLDGNGDGVAECYYFDGNGYMLANTTTPDGYTVNADGAWTVNGVVQTKSVAVNNGNAATGGVNHNAGYDPAHPLAGKIDEWNLRLGNTGLIGENGNSINICNENIQALLTNQMDKYYIPPVGNSINPTTGTQIYFFQEDYDKNVYDTQALYQWFCNWLNGMDFENMSEMQRAREIQKILGQGTYEAMGALERNGYYSVLIDKKGLCAEYALTACSLAKALGLKSAISGTGDHVVYYIRVNGTAYMGSNQVLNLDFPTPDNVYFQ